MVPFHHLCSLYHQYGSHMKWWNTFPMKNQVCILWSNGCLEYRFLEWQYTHHWEGQCLNFQFPLWYCHLRGSIINDEDNIAVIPDLVQNAEMYTSDWEIHNCIFLSWKISPTLSLTVPLVYLLGHQKNSYKWYGPYSLCPVWIEMCWIIVVRMMMITHIFAVSTKVMLCHCDDG